MVLIAVYLAVQLAYCFGLKHQPVLDICIVASGFLLRAIAGGVATGIPLSQAFLLCAGFGSLFMVAGKRYAEMMLAERTGAKIRKSLEAYSASYLRFVWALSATVLIMNVLPVGVRDPRGAPQHGLVDHLDRAVRHGRAAVLRRRRQRQRRRARRDRAARPGAAGARVIWVATLTLAVYTG